MEHKLTKSSTDKKLFGVCGGFAEYFGIDSTIVRAIVVGLVVFGGSGIAIYLIMALVMPEDDIY